VRGAFLSHSIKCGGNALAKKKTVSRPKKTVPLKSVTLAEQNPAAVDLEAFAQALAKKSRKKRK
jgi:hypothetical protein